jgi:hypothetical protein
MNADWMRRLVLAIIIASVLSVLFGAFAAGLPALAETTALAIGSVLTAAIYVLLIPGLYFASLGAEKIGIARWLAFPALFFAICAGYAYFSLSALTSYEIASGILVAHGKLTPAGWVYWEQGAAGKAAIALIVTIVLFGWPSSWLPEDA